MLDLLNTPICMLHKTMCVLIFYASTPVQHRNTMWVLQTLQLHFQGQVYHLYFKRYDDLTPARTDVADQSQIDGCLVMSGCCLPSAVDEEWYSSKRPSSIRFVNVYAETSTYFCIRNIMQHYRFSKFKQFSSHHQNTVVPH